MSRKIAVTAMSRMSMRARSDSLRELVIGPPSRPLPPPRPSPRTGLPPLSRPEAVAHASLGVDHRWPERVQLAPQIADVGLHDLGLAGVVPSPYVLEELRPGEHPSLVPHQVCEQAELGWGQLDGDAAAVHGPASLVEFHVAGAQDLAVAIALVALRGPGCTAQHRADPGHQGLDRERLRDVVIAAERQAGDGVRGRVPRRQEDHRDFVARRAQPAAYLEAVHVRQHYVEHDQVGPVRPGLPQRVLPRSRRGHRAAMKLQRDLYQLANVRLVVYDEHLGNAVIVCHQVSGSFSRAGSLPWTPAVHSMKRRRRALPQVITDAAASGVMCPGCCPAQLTGLVPVGRKPVADGGVGVGDKLPKPGLTTISLASSPPLITEPPAKTCSP